MTRRVQTTRQAIGGGLRAAATSVIFACAVTTAHAADARPHLAPPAVPDNLQAPAGDRPFLAGHAFGTQNYVCLPSGAAVAWTFFAPQATLFDDDHQQIITHFLSPNPADGGRPRATWQHSRDSSSVWALQVANSTDPRFVAPGAIPWLLLQVVGAQYGPASGDKLVATSVIQRVNTRGGAAPASGCDGPGDVGSKVLVPYTADYFFYRH
jgi:hypothetical protein